MHRWLLLMVAVLSSAAMAAGPAAVRKQAEASMLVTGRVTIETDGSVSAWEVDQREKLPPGVIRLVDQAVAQWKFEPVLLDGKVTRGRARMSLLLVADPLGDGRYEMSIRSGNFGRAALSGEEQQRLGPEPDQVSSRELKPPKYPLRAQNMGAEGIVYVALRVGRDGTVQEAAVEQVNLRTVGVEQQMRMMRETFANSALAAARGWTFHTPSRGEWANADSWTVRVPVDYRFTDARTTAYGKWEAYIPGPRTPLPWPTGEAEGSEAAPEALIAGEVHQAGTGLKLLTPLQGG